MWKYDFFILEWRIEHDEFIFGIIGGWWGRSIFCHYEKAWLGSDGVSYCRVCQKWRRSIRDGRGNPAGCCDDRHQNAIHGRTDLKQEIKRTISENKNYYLIFGKESTGIPKEILHNNLDKCYRIPTSENIRALNLSNCVALITYEALRQQNFPNLLRSDPFKGEDYLKKEDGLNQ